MENVESNQEFENLMNLNIQILCSYLEFKKQCNKRKKLSKRRLLILQKFQLKNKAVINKILSRQPVQRSCWMKPELHLEGHGTYWEISVPSFTEEWFIKKFRMSRHAFNLLCESVEPYIKKQDTNFRKAIPFQKRVAVAITILKGTTDLSTVSDLFGIGYSTVSKLLIEFCDAVQIAFSSLMQFPRTEEERTNLVNKFLSRWQFPETFGAIDGTHIPIIPPFGKRSDYINYKFFYSINVLAVCNHEYKFIYTVIGAPGRCHDASVFRRSKFFNMFNEKKITQYHIIGDGAFPLLDFVMKPFPEAVDMPIWHGNFNYRLSRARMVIEDSFGRLKARWRILLRRPDLHYETSLKVIKTCFLLHNFCEENFNQINDEWVNEARREEADYERFFYENLAYQHQKNVPEIYNDDQVSAKLKRLRIAKHVMQDGFSIRENN